MWELHNMAFNEMCTCYVSYAMPQFIKLMTTHYGSLLIKNCIIVICPLTPIFQGNNWFILKYLDFFIYIWGTSCFEATAAMKPTRLLTGRWKDVLQIFGTSWMLCGSNEWNIVDICALNGGDCQNGCFEVFWREGSVWPLSKFHKYSAEIFLSEFVGNFLPVSNRFVMF